MHATYTQKDPSNIWAFQNPVRTLKADWLRVLVRDEEGRTLVPISKTITRDHVTLTFLESVKGSALVTDCMDDELV